MKHKKIAEKITSVFIAMLCLRQIARLVFKPIPKLTPSLINCKVTIIVYYIKKRHILCIS